MNVEKQLLKYVKHLANSDYTIFNADEFEAWLQHQPLEVNNYWQKNRYQKFGIKTEQDVQNDYALAINSAKHNHEVSIDDVTHYENNLANVIHAKYVRNYAAYYKATSTDAQQGTYCLSNQEFINIIKSRLANQPKSA